MKYLLTNDDGIDAAGLALVADLLSARGDVTVVAPRDEQSGVGHRVHTREHLALDERAPGRYALAGTPADCVRVAMRGLSVQPDWVISGLNHGGNLGVDIHMSGTVAGAREAAILGVPAIAVSQVLSAKHPIEPARVRRMTTHVLSTLLARPLSPGRLYNVNLPFCAVTDEPELVFCGPDPSPHDVRYTEGEGGYRYAGVFLDRPRLSGCDVEIVFGGKVAVSELSIV
jgi:5'-nucleotidase